MLWTQFSDPIYFPEVVRPDLDDCVQVLILFELHILIFLLATNENVHVELFVNLCNNEIEDWDDIGWVIYNLAVQTLIELEDMIAVNLQHILVEFTDFLQFLHIEALLDVLGVVLLFIIILSNLLKVVDEVFEFHLNIASVDVGPPDNLSM